MYVGPSENLLSTLPPRRGAWLMGVLNVTPDSFHDGGRHFAADDARARVDALLDEGADLIDIGGESTRPGCTPVPAEEQLRRIGPALSHAVARGAIVSVDTASAEVAASAMALGARLINDVSCLADEGLARVTAHGGGVLILMHSREPMSALRGFSEYPASAYADVVTEVLTEWRRARDRALRQGMGEPDVWLDPGIGFAKNARQSFELLQRLTELTLERVPVVVGTSRKSFIAAIDSAPSAERLGGTIAACLHAVDRGARVLRVHDVRAVRQALDVTRVARDAREIAHAR